MRGRRRGGGTYLVKSASEGVAHLGEGLLVHLELDSSLTNHELDDPLSEKLITVMIASVGQSVTLWARATTILGGGLLRDRA